MEDNSSYTVTYPDLMLTDDSFTLLVISTNESLIQTIKSKFEHVVRSSVIFYVHNQPTTQNNIAWPFHIFQTCDVVIVDLDTCSYEDAFFITEKTVDDHHWGVFINQNNTKRTLCRLLNAQGKYTMLNNLQHELDEWINTEIVGDSI